MSDQVKFLLIVLAAILGGTLAIGGIDDPGQVKPCPDGKCVPLNADPLPRGTLIGGVPGVVLDLPPELREPNWGGGSCVHASTVMVLRWQGQYEMADWWREQYIGGEYSDRLIKRMEAANLRYAYTVDGDFEFIRWTVRTKRGCGIFYKPNHAINLIGMDDQYVYLLDNNDVNRPEREGTPERVSIEDFVLLWRSYGGFAWTVVYSPHPPDPWID